MIGKRYASDDEVLARLRRLEHRVGTLRVGEGNAATAGLAPHSLLGVEHAATVASPPVLGGTIYGNVTPEWEQLVGNIAAIKKFLTQLGTGAVSAAPIWDTIEQADVVDLTSADGPTFDHLHITNGATFGDQPRAATSLYRRYYRLPLGSANPGASGATWIPGDANTPGGWQIDAAAEVLRGAAGVHADWDGVSDIKFEVKFQVNINNLGGDAGDTVDFKIVARYMGVGDVAVKTQTVEVPTIVGASTQYKMFDVVFTLDYDAAGNVIETGDQISIYLNLETDTSEVDNVIITGMTLSYLTTHLAIEDGDE